MRMIGLLIVCSTIVGSGAYGMFEYHSAPGAFPMSVSFAVDTEGKSITILSDVHPGEVNTQRRLMIALDVPHGADLPAVDDIRIKPRSMRVDISDDDHGIGIPVATEDDESIIACNTDKPLPHSDTWSLVLIHADERPRSAQLWLRAGGKWLDASKWKKNTEPSKRPAPGH